MTEYTPTTEEVKDTHRRGVSGDRYPTRNGEWRNPDAEFDRWLAERDRQVAERAWNECANRVGQIVAAQPPELLTQLLRATNPYRKEAAADWPPPKSRDEIRKGAIDEIAELLEKKEATGD